MLLDVVIIFFSAVVIIVFIPFYFDMQLDGSSTCDQTDNCMQKRDIFRRLFRASVFFSQILHPRKCFS